MNPKSPEAVKEAAIARQNGHAAARAPIQLNPSGALFSVLVRALSESREVDAALKTFLEAKGLDGQWFLRITSADLLPGEQRA